MDQMSDHSFSNKQVMMMAFGLPVMTTGIVIASMYAGHVLTTRSDRPTNVMVSSAPPKIDVNVPQSAPPSVQVSAPPATVDVHVPTPNVDVHVPQSAAPIVTVNTPPMPAPNITVSPAIPTVTVIREEHEKETRAVALEKPAAAPAAPGAFVAPPDAAKPAETKTSASTTDASSAAKPETPAAKPVEAAKPSDASNAIKNVRDSLKSPPEKLTVPSSTSGQSSLNSSEPKPILASHPSNALLSPLPGKPEDLSIDTLYRCATQYIQAYCKKNNLDPVVEERKWNKTWRASVEQAINDNIDSSEQSYINRMVIAKRDYFNIEKASPEKIVEACRIMLRYRDGQLAWLSAMKDALTEDNFKKTVAFLSAGPK